MCIVYTFKVRDIMIKNEEKKREEKHSKICIDDSGLK